MKRKDAETQRINELSNLIIGAGIEVHRHLGPGLLESAYEECLYYELNSMNVDVQRQVSIPVVYKEVKLDCGYRADLVVEDSVIIELKTIDKMAPIHGVQLLTYLRLLDKRLGILMNFNVPILKQGIKRIVNNL